MEAEHDLFDAGRARVDALVRLVEDDVDGLVEAFESSLEGESVRCCGCSDVVLGGYLRRNCGRLL